MRTPQARKGPPGFTKKLRQDPIEGTRPFEKKGIKGPPPGFEKKLPNCPPGFENLRNIALPKPYQCATCNAEFEEKGGLNEHISNVHNEKLPKWLENHVFKHRPVSENQVLKYLEGTVYILEQ